MFPFTVIELESQKKALVSASLFTVASIRKYHLASNHLYTKRDTVITHQNFVAAFQVRTYNKENSSTASIREKELNW